MSAETPQNTPPGWYVDPAGSSGWRFFDGETWTDQVQQEVKNLAAAQLRNNVAPLAIRLHKYFLPGTAVLVGLSFILKYLSQDLLHSGHAIVEWIRAGDTNAPLPSLTTSGSGAEGAIVNLASLASLSTLVMLLIWQYRSATEAEALGYPMKISRRLGIWSWFIPVANYYLPFKALSDLLPPDDEHRKIAWVLCGVSGVRLVGTVSLFAAIVSGSTSWWTVWFIVGFSTSVAVQLLRRQLLMAIEANHEAFGKTLR